VSNCPKSVLQFFSKRPAREDLHNKRGLDQKIREQRSTKISKSREISACEQQQPSCQWILGGRGGPIWAWEWCSSRCIYCHALNRFAHFSAKEEKNAQPYQPCVCAHNDRWGKQKTTMLRSWYPLAPETELGRRIAATRPGWRRVQLPTCYLAHRSFRRVA
jgi:hypothetical protein